ncbi:MAG: phage tail protein [Solibacillus sp.]
MSIYYTLLTDIGMAKIVNATLAKQKVDVIEMAVGDGGGVAYRPTQKATALKNELWRGVVHLVEPDENNPNWIVIESAIPSTVGGFTIREVGLYDADGDLIAIANTPETYKPQLHEGSAKDLYWKTILEVSNAKAITLKVDPAAAIANRKYVDEKLQIINTQLIQKTEIVVTNENIPIPSRKSGSFYLIVTDTAPSGTSTITVSPTMGIKKIEE